MSICEKEGCKYKVRSGRLCRRHVNELKGTPCTVDGCEKPIWAKKVCQMHYYRLTRHGHAGGAETTRRGKRPCRVIDCKNDAVTRDDLCPTHRRRKQLYGDPGGTLATTMTCAVCGERAIFTHRFVDRCATHAWDRLLEMHLAGEEAGTRDRVGYVYLSVNKKRRPVHRLVMERALGRPMYDNETPRHLNGIRDDNRIENLELWVYAQKPGQRLDDVLRYYVTRYPKEIEAILAEI